MAGADAREVVVMMMPVKFHLHRRNHFKDGITADHVLDHVLLVAALTTGVVVVVAAVKGLVVIRPTIIM